MIHWLQKKYGLKDSNLKGDLEKLRQQVQEYRKKYNKEDKEMEVSSESDSDVDPEEQKKIDEEMRKRQEKKKGMRTSVSAEVYGIHNVKNHMYLELYQKQKNKKKELKIDACLALYLIL